MNCVLFVQTYNKTFHELYYLLKWSCKNATIHFSYFIQLKINDVASYIQEINNGIYKNPLYWKYLITFTKCFPVLRGHSVLYYYFILQICCLKLHSHNKYNWILPSYMSLVLQRNHFCWRLLFFMTKETLSCCVDRLKIICEFCFDKDLYDIFCQAQVVKNIMILNGY